MDLLLDVNLSVDVCTGRAPYYRAAELALAKCRTEGARLWLYAGSVQTLEYVTRAELRRGNGEKGIHLSARQLAMQTRELLRLRTNRSISST